MRRWQEDWQNNKKGENENMKNSLTIKYFFLIYTWYSSPSSSFLVPEYRFPILGADPLYPFEKECENEKMARGLAK